METPIKTPNHLFFTDIELFKYYINEIHSLLPIFLTDFIEKTDSNQFFDITNRIVNEVNEVIKNQDFTVASMNYYNRLVFSQSEPYQIIHDNMLEKFVITKSQEDIVIEDLCKSFNELMIEDNLMEVEPIVSQQNLIVQTNFSSDPDAQAISLRPIKVTPPKNRNHYVVDALNFFSAILTPLSRKQADFGFMDVDRKVDKHQFDCEIEQKRAFEHAEDFFKKAVPIGSSIHFVFKQFYYGKKWNEFTQCFADFFMDNNNPHDHYYYFYVAKAESPNDGECDDRLTVRLALELKCNNLNRVFVVSNDNYQSMSSHWNEQSSYFKYCSNNISNNKNHYVIKKKFPISSVYNLDKIKFSFWAEKDLFSEVATLKMDFGECY